MAYQTEDFHYLPPELCREDSLIEMDGIVKIFKNAAGEFTALKGVSACFYTGEFVSIVGKSGSGKSTLVNMLTGIDHPTAGSVRVEQAYIHQMTENDMSLWRGSHLGIIFQFFQLMPMLTLLENVMLPMVLAKKYKTSEREKRAKELLGLVNLADFSDKLPAAVSGGQQQSAAIARALANDPPILIADEPTGNLDSRSAEEVFQLFDELIAQCKTILVVTHDASLARQTKRTLLLSDGELVNPWVAEAFPMLPHPQMLWLTHHVKEITPPAGSILTLPGTDNNGLYVVAQGVLEINKSIGKDRNGSGYKLVPGSSLTSIDLEGRDYSDSLLHVSEDGPARLFVLDNPTLHEWLNVTPTARETLMQAMQHKQAGLHQAAGTAGGRV